MKINQKKYFIYIFICFSILINSCKKKTFLGNENLENKIEEHMNKVLQEKGIPGAALAIVKNDSLIFKKNFGKANLEHNVSISDSSIFRVYSLTKPIISVAIFQLIEQNKLSLDDELSKYFDEIPTSWQSVKIVNLLTHSSGLPDIIDFSNTETIEEKEAEENVFKAANEFEKGEIYKYNQTNFWLLHKIIEKITGETLQDFVAKHQFEGERKNVFFSSDSKEIIKNRVTPYFPFTTGKMRIEHATVLGSYMYAANGLNITLNEFIKWDKRLRENKLIKKATKKQMWQTFKYKKSERIFTNGWGKTILNKHNSFGFTGSLVTAYRIFPDDDLSIILLSNGLSNIYNIDEVVDELANFFDKDIYDVEEKLIKDLYTIMSVQNFEAFFKEYQICKKEKEFKNINLKDVLNDVGYLLLRNDEIDKSLAVFNLNIQENPTSANIFDSLAEAYFVKKEYNLSSEYYRKAIALGGTNGNAKMMLEKINLIKSN
jgi:CubicO group peptidase (beta-lactamase class C family)